MAGSPIMLRGTDGRQLKMASEQRTDLHVWQQAAMGPPFTAEEYCQVLAEILPARQG